MKNYQRLLLSIISALLLFLSFKDLGFLAWVSLAPFLIVIYNSNLKQTLLNSFICGISFFASVTYWMTELPVKYTWLLVAILLSPIFLLFGIVSYFIIKKIHQPFIRIFLVPAVWILMEYLRSQTLLAFTIGILGYTQHNFLPLMHVTRFTGIYGISFIVILCNMVIFETVIFSIKNKKVIFKYLTVGLSILLIFITYGIISVNNNLNRVVRGKGYNEISVAVVQPDILFGKKYSKKGTELIPEPYSESTYFKPGTDLVIFPESALWGSIDESKTFEEWARNTLENEPLCILIGQYMHDKEYNRYYNSALLYNSNMEILGRYDEIHPVPFSQYVPYRRILGLLKFVDFSIVNLIPGNDYISLNYPGKGNLGVNICYESTIPSIARKTRNNGAEAIIVISDGSSLNDSIATWHHLIFSKVRAIENGCYVVQCANTGISSIISPDGMIMARTDLLEREVLYGSIYMIPEKTFYSKFGNLLFFIYMGLISSITVIHLILRKTKGTRK